MNGIDAAKVGSNARPNDTGKLSNNLAGVFEEQDQIQGDLASVAASRGMQTAGEAIVLDVVLDRYASNLPTLLRRAGGRVRHVSEKYLRASVAVPGRDAATRIAAIPLVERVYPTYGPVTRVGAVTSRAVDALDAANLSPLLAPEDLDGTGQKVGILSDSFNRTAGVHNAGTVPEACNAGSLTGSNPQQSGDLPSSLEIRADDVDGGPSADACPDDGSLNPGKLSDEGAAMAELIHDLAPDAALAFHTGFGGLGVFASGIDDLCTSTSGGGAGSTVLVDDVIYPKELMYQPDVVSQAIRDCEASGVPYFTAAGNDGDLGFRRDYTDFDPNDNDDDATDADDDGGPPSSFNGDYHDWNPSGTPDDELGITVAPGEGFTAILQWNQPALSVPQNASNGPQVDLDLYLQNNGTVVASSAQSQQSSDPSSGADPVEILQYTNGTRSNQTLALIIDHWTGSRTNIPQGSNPPLEFRLLFTQVAGSPSFEYSPSGPTTYGHAQASAGASVAAVPWWEAPAFDPGNQGPTSDIDPEPFTSRGGTLTRFFNADGTFNKTSTEEPTMAAVDGNNTTFFGDNNSTPTIDGEDDGFPNFFGTSAAAPNVAAITALLQDYAAGVEPQDLYRALAGTATDVTGKRAAFGGDDTTGAGLINAESALEEFPTAEADGDPGTFIVTPGSSVTLDGSRSTDPGPPLDSNAQSGITSYKWTQLQGISVSLSDDTAVQPTFTAPNQEGTLKFELRVEDGDGLSAADTVTVFNEYFPEASDDSVTVNEGSANNRIDVLANDNFGGDGAGSSTIFVSNAGPGSPSDGDVAVDDNGTGSDPTDDVVEYTPDPGFSGSDSFSYEIEDGDGDTASATVNVTVDPTPTASDDSTSVDEDSSVNVDVLANDDFGGDGPSSSAIAVTSGPSNGTATVDDNGTGNDPTDDSIEYAPAPDYNGSDSLTYEITDSNGDVASATVSVTVKPVDDGDPNAGDDSVVVDEDQSVNVEVLANDSFGPDGAGDRRVEVTGAASHGVTSVADNGTPNNPTDDTINYTPDANYNGSDSFTYEIADSDGELAVATVSVMVSPVNDLPSASDDSATVDEDGRVDVDVLANDNFGGDGPSDGSISVSSLASNGVAAVDDNGTANDPTDDSINYTPDPDYNGPDSFSYEVADSNGDTATATVNVTVNPVNDLPSAADDSATVETGSRVSVDVLANDDFGGDGTSNSAITIANGAANGTATVDDNGTANDPSDDAIEYTPEPNYTGPDSFDYTIADSDDGEKATATVSVDVTTASDDDSGGSGGGDGDGSGGGGGGGGGALGWLLLSGLLCGVVGLRRRGYGVA